ncbi:hypothetical protein N7468_010094 [Penicillium chermesinum]|uniref:Altered inheritance of mitochondria protein 41 n=1 Tax=Penicillium chermesinum TaxID=63820 RepID=A0A9W9TC45_9EURO|nr:uncharacterized protein N7468_010094 [Penicillium chermesinum]KAJ5217086.1 hypothetical protein N7468_010094 [Penicillium chermesinum]KAJ6171298.1 hypothetical protein N7470_000365 [Penicillium chermesinum]
MFSATLPVRSTLRSLGAVRPIQVRWNSSAVPPLMATLRTDLKTAMRAKDTARLNVLRALISETNNAAKTASPIQTDIQLLSLIRKRAAAAQDAADQFAAAERPDLKQKEDEQIAILEEYASQVKTLSAEEVEAIIKQQVAAIKEAGTKLDAGQVLKALFAPGGALDGKPADRKEVAGLVKKAIV